MIRSVSLLSSVVGCLLPVLANAQTAQPSMGENSRNLRLACMAGAVSNFGPGDVRIIQSTPVAGGMEFQLQVPGQEAPWTCIALTGSGYLSQTR